MRQIIMKRLLIAGLALLTVPAGVLAQNEKIKTKESKESKDFQQIIVTRTGDKNEKTVIEIQGDKVKVNGKEINDDKDVKVNVHSFKTPDVYRMAPNVQGYSTTIAGDNFSFFHEDENRAMLGVVTEGKDKGAQIMSVTKESAADKAGLKKGDVITNIGGKSIDDSEDVSEAVKSHKPGEKVAITILRDGKEQKLTAELGKWKGIRMNTLAPSFNENVIRDYGTFNRISPSTEPFVFNGSGFVYGRPRLGLSIQDTDDGKGVKVLEVDEESHAAKAGVQEGDIITEFDGKAVNSADEVSKMLKEKKDQPSFKLQVLRNGKSQPIEVKIPKKLKTVDL